MIYWSIKLGKKIPFKIYRKSTICIRSSSLILNGRVNLGSQRHLPTISNSPVNLFFDNYSIVEIGHSVTLGQGVNLIVKKNAKLKIGDSTNLTSDMHIECMHSVAIGNNCAISWGVTIIDDDHHEILYTDKVIDSKKNEVIIGSHTWIGCHSVILRGTTIGENSIVGAGSVVKGSFPPNSLIAGNPARVIQHNVNWR